MRHLVGVVVVAVTYARCDALELFFAKLVAGLALEVLNGHALDVASVYHVREVRVFGVAVDEVCRVDVLLNDSVVRVVLTLDYANAVDHEVLYSTTKNLFIEVVPVQREVGSKLCY